MKTSKKFGVLLPIKIDSRWGFLKVSVWNIYVWVFTPWIFKGLFEIIVPSLMHTVYFCNNCEVNRSALLQCKYREGFLTGEDTDAQLEYHISTSKCLQTFCITVNCSCDVSWSLFKYLHILYIVFFVCFL